MEYTVKALARLTGVTERTLRWYDAIGLLPPQGTTAAGYRIYGPEQVDRLQQILFYRALGLGLEEIKAILDDPRFDRQEALQSHLTALRERREQLDGLIRAVERTLLETKGEITMTDKEKFSALKQQIVAENESKYGAESRKTYGDEAVDAGNRAILAMDGGKMAAWQALDEELRQALEQAVRTGETPAGEEGQRIAALHAKWLTHTLRPYDAARHAGIARLYVMDERFTAYYDRAVPGCAQFLCDAVAVYTAGK